jgi:hypothetical protein
MMQIGRTINVVNISKSELARKIKGKDPFVETIFRENPLKIV